MTSSCRAQVLIASASLAAEHGLQGTRALVAAVPGLQSTGSIVGAHGLACSTPCGTFPDQGPNSCLPHWQVESLPPSHQGSPGKLLLANREVFLVSLRLIVGSNKTTHSFWSITCGTKVNRMK